MNNQRKLKAVNLDSYKPLRGIGIGGYFGGTYYKWY